MEQFNIALNMPVVEQFHLDLNMTPPDEEEVNIPGVHQHAEPEIDQDEIDPGVGDMIHLSSTRFF